MKRIIASAVALSLVVSAAGASAQTVDIASLLAQINALQAQIAALTGGSYSGTATFSTDLALGARSADVMNLQKFLNNTATPVATTGVGSKGYETNYFGAKTKAALMKYQAWANLPVTGIADSWTRAKISGGAATPGVVVAVPGVIATKGSEGTLAVTSYSSGLASTVYENDSKVAILGFQAEAKNSDIAIQRVKLDLGASTKFYNKIFKKIYITDTNGNVLASSDLNSDTVIKDGSTYYITVTGMNSVVSKGTKQNFLVKADVYSSIDSTDYDVETYPIAIAANGVRGVDGAGIDQYSPASASTVTRTPTISADLVDNATLTLSTNVNTPQAAEVIAASGSSENELDKLTALTFDVKAEKDNVIITDLVIDVVKTGTGGATASTTVYLYDGSTELDSATVSSGAATFSDLDYEVPRDSTKTLTVKVDLRNANGTVSNIALDIDTADITAENSRGDSITESGSAVGETFYVRNVGPQFTLVSKSISKSGTASQSNTSTSTATALFNVKIKAVGGAITFGTVASATPAFGTSTTYFKSYVGGSASTLLVASTTSYSTPSSGVVTAGLTESWTLQEGNEITIPVEFYLEGRTTAGALVTGGSYAIGLEGIKWSTNTTSANTSNFMAGDSDWRTSGVALP